jgi:hypothetical protein
MFPPAACPVINRRTTRAAMIEGRLLENYAPLKVFYYAASRCRKFIRRA